MMTGILNWINSVFGMLVDNFDFFPDVVDILLVAFLLYEAILLVRQTRASQLFRGIAILLIAWLLSYWFQLRVIKFLLDKLLQFGLLAVVVVFQPEIRRALEQVGRSKFIFGLFQTQKDTQREQWREAIVTICDSAERMARKRTGALIVIERQSRLGDIDRTGTKLDAKLTGELLETIFYAGSPLHDGAVIVKDARVSAAGCLLPVSQNSEISKDMGTRHRAAIGLSENADALVVVVSEETGIISLAQNGVIIRRLDRANLYRILEGDLLPKEEEEQAKGRKKWLGRFLKR
jgi:diadenylate cyclase